MNFKLFYQGGSPAVPQERTKQFSTEPEAVIFACALMARGGHDGFRIEDEDGEIVTTEVDIRNRCKGTRMP